MSVAIKRDNNEADRIMSLSKSVLRKRPFDAANANKTRAAAVALAIAAASKQQASMDYMQQQEKKQLSASKPQTNYSDESQWPQHFLNTAQSTDISKEARCGEIFVANNANKWTFICTYCHKSTNDIGEFMLHIKKRHIETTMGSSQTNPLTRDVAQKDNSFHEDHDEQEVRKLHSLSCSITESGYRNLKSNSQNNINMEMMTDHDFLENDSDRPKKILIDTTSKSKIEIAAKNTAGARSKYFDCGNLLHISLKSDPEAVKDSSSNDEPKEEKLSQPSTPADLENSSTKYREYEVQRSDQPAQQSELQKPYCKITIKTESDENISDLEEPTMSLVKKEICQQSPTSFFSTSTASPLKDLKKVVDNILPDSKKMSDDESDNDNCSVDCNEFLMRNIVDADGLNMQDKYSYDDEDPLSDAEMTDYKDSDDDFDSQLLLKPNEICETNGEYPINIFPSVFKEKRRPIRGTAYCAICKRTFQYYSLYRNHMMKHSDATPFKCNICEKGFKSKQAIRYHMKTHDTVKPFQCKICFQKFVIDSLYIRHVVNHENQNSKIFPCKVCGDILKSESERNTHMGTHSRDRPFPCKYCSKLFRLRHHLSNHLKLHRQYRCDYCKAEFNSDVHQRKPYACPNCVTLTEVQRRQKAMANGAGSLNVSNANTVPSTASSFYSNAASRNVKCTDQYNSDMEDLEQMEESAYNAEETDVASDKRSWMSAFGSD